VLWRERGIMFCIYHKGGGESRTTKGSNGSKAEGDVGAKPVENRETRGSGGMLHKFRSEYEKRREEEGVGLLTGSD